MLPGVSKGLLVDPSQAVVAQTQVLQGDRVAEGAGLDSTNVVVVQLEIKNGRNNNNVVKF